MLNNSFSLRHRLLMGFASITTILLISIVITLIMVTSSKNYAREVIEIELPTYDSFLELNSQIHHSQSLLTTYLLTHSDLYKKELDQNWNLINQTILKIDNLATSGMDDAQKKEWFEVKSLLGSLKSAEIKLTTNVTSEQALSLLINEVIPIQNKIYDILEGSENSSGVRAGGIFDAQYKILENGSHTVMEKMTLVQTLEWVLLLLGFLVSVGIALYTAKSILHHVNIFRQYSNKIASGDLTQRISVQSNDELGLLGQDLNIMTESLSTMTKQITEACHNMVSALEEVRNGVDVQATGASEQASSINQITASLEEIEKSSNQTMDKAKALGESASRTREKGQLGLEAVEQSIIGMKIVREKVQTIAQTILELSNQTQQVGEITALVNTLSQQSKMLALNASIEAAKAGDAGKGFAVVAAEVKTLAEQSEQSTAQVQKILEEIRRATEKAVMVTEEGTKGVDHGTDLVEQTGEIVRSLSDVIHETTIASQQIEAAIRQEGVGIEQITSGMNEINQVTGSFVDNVKQTTEAIGNLSMIAKNLKDHIDTYKL